MKLFPFQEAFKSGSSVCPHRKFLCFNFPKKEISLRSEPSICLWAELFQETLAAESWKHPWALCCCWDAGINSWAFTQRVGTPLKLTPGHPFLPLLQSLVSLPFLPSCETPSFNPPRGSQFLSLHEETGVSTCAPVWQPLTNAPHGHHGAASTQSTDSCFPLSLAHTLETSGISNQEGTRK